MTEEVARKFGVEEARERIAELLLIAEEGGPNQVEEAVRIAKSAGLAEEPVRGSFAEALKAGLETRAKVISAGLEGGLDGGGPGVAFSRPETQSRGESELKHNRPLRGLLGSLMQP